MESTLNEIKDQLKRIESMLAQLTSEKQKDSKDSESVSKEIWVKTYY